MNSKRTVILRPAKQNTVYMTDTSMTFISLLDTQQVSFTPLVRHVSCSPPTSDSQPIFQDLRRSSSPSPMKSTKSSTNRRRKHVSLGEPVSQPSPAGPQHGKCILLVDDDSTVRDSLNNVLVAEGYSVIPAENGQQALDSVNKCIGGPCDARPEHACKKWVGHLRAAHRRVIRSSPSSLSPRVRINSSWHSTLAWVRSWRNPWTYRHCCERRKNFSRRAPSNAWRAWPAKKQNFTTSLQLRVSSTAGQQEIGEIFGWDSSDERAEYSSAASSNQRELPPCRC